MAKFAINASGAMLLPSLVQVSESISGSVVPLAMFFVPFPKVQRQKAAKKGVMPLLKEWKAVMGKKQVGNSVYWCC